MNASPLRQVFERLPDPLAEQRQSQPLGHTLTMVFLVLVRGEKSARRLAAWIKEQRGRLKRDDAPSYSTIQDTLLSVD